MPFSIDYKKSQHYYYLSFSGEDTQADYLQVREDLLNLTGSQQPRIKVLVNLFQSSKTNMTRAEQFELIEKFNDGSLLNMKIALVVPKILNDQNDWYFIVDLAKNFQINVKPFYTEVQALEWLLDS